jgi:hypothetical protein
MSVSEGRMKESGEFAAYSGHLGGEMFTALFNQSKLKKIESSFIETKRNGASVSFIYLYRSLSKRTDSP